VSGCGSSTRPSAFLASATLALLVPFAVAADEAQEAAEREMTAALGAVPPFIALLPESAQPGAWAFMKGSSGDPAGEIPAKYRELIALGVAAQIPCSYCAYAHTAFAKANGATDEEVREAVSYAGEVRLWSTILNGNQFDLEQFKSDIDRILAHVAEASKSD
jgi:AhpD family alkylhydroperoxidase